MGQIFLCRRRGFTLVEILVVLAILGIIAAVALPAYRDSVLRSGRADGKAALMKAAADQEQFYALNNSYSAKAAPLASPAQDTVTSPEGKYVISVAACSGGTIASCFTATATPQGSQAEDDCTTLTISSSGARGATGASSNECWQR